MAEIERPAGNHYEMRACLRGPHLDGMVAAVRRMLETTRVSA